MNRRGFATITALVLMLLVGAALAAMTSLLGAEVRRTVRHQKDAQLRQLLSASTIAARTHLANHPEPGDSAVWSMDLPASLSADGQPASVTLDRRPVGDDVEIRVEARLGSSRAGQLTRWARQGDAWTLVSAELGT